MNNCSTIINKNILGWLMGKAENICDCDVLHKEIVEIVKPDMPSNNVVADISDFFKVLGDSTRVQILWALSKSDMCVCDIAFLINMTKSAVSHQLKILKDYNLVKCKRNGKEVIYSLADSHVKDIFEKAVEHLYESK